MKRFVIALMVTATAAISFAQTGDRGQFHPRARGARQFASELNLTDAQRQQLKDIRTASREQNKQLHVDYRAKLQQYRALKTANDPAASDVKAQLEAMKPQLKAARKASREAMLNVFTPEQRAQLKEARHEGFGRGKAHLMPGVVAEKLNLTDEQRAQLKQIRETSHQNNAQLFADAKAKRQELRSLTKAGDPGAADVKAQLEALRPQLEAARKQRHAEFRKILTPGQLR